MTEFWNSRFATKEFIYGKSPNKFFRTEIQKLIAGKILFPAEGEGRNAVYAAQRGFDVYAFDASETAKNKALLLAEEKKVSINYKIAGYHDVVYPENEFDVLVLIFAHMPTEFRAIWHRKLLRFIKPGGKLILEGFSKEQIDFDSGGPKDLAMLFSENELLDDFKELSDIKLSKKITTLNEGQFHRGKASVIQLIGIR